jgi:methionyl aminopeptidase
MTHGSPYPQRKGPLSPPRTVPPSIVRPPYVLGVGIPSYPEPQIHDAAGRDRMRRAGALAAAVLHAAGSLAVLPGVSTDEIDAFVHAETIRASAYPSPLGYAGFPKSVCTSVNEVVCHGIPEPGVVLRNGDVVKLDVSVYLDGVHGDTCRTWIVGGHEAGDEAGRHLVTSTKAMLDSALRLCGPGVPIKVIGAHIAAECERTRLESVTAFAGHGIGETFHTNPIVHHCVNASPYVMVEGMTFTIEPMITEGGAGVDMWGDGWTVVTKDRGRAAQFEHTVLITAHGGEITTAYE